jgi:hypothetical protein
MGAIYLLSGSLIVGLILVLINERQLQHSGTSSTPSKDVDPDKLPFDFSLPKDYEKKIRKSQRNEFSGDYKRMRRELTSLRMLLFLILVAVVLYFNLKGQA